MNLAEQFPGGYLATDLFTGFARTDLRAGETVRAWWTGKRNTFRFKTKCPLRAAFDALPAADASFFFVSQKGCRVNAFRVVAPAAGQRAPFHENRGADARAVMDSIAFNVEYDTCCRAASFHYLIYKIRIDFKVVPIPKLHCLNPKSQIPNKLQITKFKSETDLRIQ